MLIIKYWTKVLTSEWNEFKTLCTGPLTPSFTSSFTNNFMYPPSSCAWRGKVKSTSRMTDTWPSIMWEIVSNIFTAKKIRWQGQRWTEQKSYLQYIRWLLHHNAAKPCHIWIFNIGKSWFKLLESDTFQKHTKDTVHRLCLSLFSISVYRTLTRKIDIAFHKA